MEASSGRRPATLRRKRRREAQSLVRASSNRPLRFWVLTALVAIVLASSRTTEQHGWGVLASDEKSERSEPASMIITPDAPPGDSKQANNDRKPHRKTYGGRIRLVPNRKMIRITTVEEHDKSPWNREETQRDTGTAGPLESASPKNTLLDKASGLWNALGPLVQRGIFLTALTAVAILDKRPPPPPSASLTTTIAGGAMEASWTTNLVTKSSSSLSRWRLDWSKLRTLPTESLPSLSAALMIAWVPNLVLHRAWWELGFLVLSLTSQESLRNYLWTEILPSLGGTVRKLFWSEFWKQSWDYLLAPFPHNLLVPTPNGSEAELPGWRSELSEFWSKRVVSRIDKWSASSVKALLQKNVQNSINGLAEDSFKAVAYAWYPENGKTSSSMRKLSSTSSNEDTRRMIELETDCEEAAAASAAVESCQEIAPAEEKEVIPSLGAGTTDEHKEGVDKDSNESPSLPMPENDQSSDDANEEATETPLAS